MRRVKLLISLLIAHSAGILGALVEANGWFDSLAKPFFMPPSWLFAPVWFLLYTLMGLSLYGVWTSKAKDKSVELSLFGAQLVLNAAWSLIFFGAHSLIFALANLLVLWSLIILTIVYFHRINRLAGYLLVPYVLWVTFAGVINIALVILN